IDEMLRVGRESIVTFPNFSHWRPRVSLGLQGLMPVSRALPNRWYSTPNIHLCTVQDFEALCRDKQVSITRRQLVNHAYRTSLATRLLPILLGEIALYQIRDAHYAASCCICCPACWRWQRAAHLPASSTPAPTRCATASSTACKFPPA